MGGLDPHTVSVVFGVALGATWVALIGSVWNLNRKKKPSDDLQ